MDHVTIQCPACGKTYQIPPDRAGHKVKCSCGNKWVANPVDQAEPVKPEPVKPGPVKPAPAKPEPVVPKPVKPEPVKPEAVEPAPVAPPDEKPPASAAVAQPVEDEDDEPAPAKPAKPAKAAKPAKPSREETAAQQLIGRELGSFKIEHLLGVGGFGAVYRAFDKSLHRHVAIKVLPEAMARAGKEKVQQFLLEARAAAKLSHPNIVTVHQICQIDGVYFIVMELVEGQSLANIVRRRRLSPQEATRIITDACRGLAHAHRRGLIHRDVKPGNVMVTAEGHVKMTDFGLARDIFRDPSDEEVGRAVGTPLYMSPEQCEGDEGDTRSDVYALAATYYVALTRRPPFEGRDTEEVMHRHRFDPVPDPRELLPSLPAAVFRIIEKAMAKEQADRYQTASELLGALEALDFDALDPNATLSLETVSAQIGTVTPAVGSHVGSVVRGAVRRAERSVRQSTVTGASEPISPIKWWILIGVLVTLLCIAAIVIAVVVATSSSEPTAGTRFGDTATTPPPTQPPSSAATTPPDDSSATTTTDASSDTTAATDTESATPEEPEEPAEPVEDEHTRAARLAFEARVNYAREKWFEDPGAVRRSFDYIIDHFGDTIYGEKAHKAIIDRMSEGKAPLPELEEDAVPADEATVDGAELLDGGDTSDASDGSDDSP